MSLPGWLLKIEYDSQFSYSKTSIERSWGKKKETCHDLNWYDTGLSADVRFF